MGGYGSGEHNAWNARWIVEKCDDLDINWLTREGVFDRPNHSTGRIHMSRPRDQQFRVDYRLELVSRRFRLFYEYEEEQLEYCIPLELGALPWGKSRWWFRCPLVRDGKPCLKRVAKLWRPPFSAWFGCRQCHNLTYRRCQIYGGSRRANQFQSSVQTCLIWEDIMEDQLIMKRIDHDAKRAEQRRQRRKAKGWS